jgi:thymidine kinase
MLEVICGGMFAGKSELLIQRLNRAGYAKKNIHVFYKLNIIEGSDPVSFETINRKQMPDQYKKFKLNSAIGVDMDYIKKKKRIYQFGIKIFEL